MGIPMKKKAYTAPVSEVHAIELQHLMGATGGDKTMNVNPNQSVSNPNLVLGREGGWSDDE